MAGTTRPYDGREQTLVKHFILRRYLRRFARIVGSYWNTITYVDCFSGPWNAQSQDLSDSSFAIALDELRSARETLQEGGRSLTIRALFLESDPDAYSRLREFATGVRDAKVDTRNLRLTDAIDEVLQFVAAGGSSAFPFVFIDPTGWSGLDLEDIRPLLRLHPGEVLINFMTDYVRRFVESPRKETVASFNRFFGCKGMKDRIQRISDPKDREDALVRSYAEQFRQAGGYPYACSAVVLYPEVDRSYFHLIYATRSRRGVEVFKEVERDAIEFMEQARAGAQQRRRVKRTKQPELFEPEVCHETERVDLLRERYLAQAREQITELLRSQSAIRYDAVWDAAMAWPLVWDSDLKDWIAAWKREGRLTVENLKPRQKVPKLGAGNCLNWREARE
jgi:three-Cys-motif partner protein